MRRFLHRFYDLVSGGAEAVILSFVRAFADDEHLLIFNRFSRSWVSEELHSLRNVGGRRIEGQDFARHVAEFRPDVLFFYWYPPMSVADFAGLPPEILNRSILYNQWYTELPYVAGLREFWFASPTCLAETGRCIPREKTRALLNPVRAEFFDVQRRADAGTSVGRHSRPTQIKFSDDFFELHEGIAVSDLQVRVLGCERELAEATQRLGKRLRHTYWMLYFNSMPATKFLSFLSVYVYKTRETFREACGVCILEALAAGLPVVAENKGGIRDLILPGETGMLCDTLEDYHRAAQTLLTNPEQWRRYSERARQWARANVSPAAYREKCEQFLARAFPEWS